MNRPEPGATVAAVGASARAAAFSLLRAGYRVRAADLFADADLAQQCPVEQISAYPSGLAQWLSATECDAWLYTGGLENEPALVERMASLKPLLGHSGDVLRRVRDPLLLQSELAAAGLAFPKTRLVTSSCPTDGDWLGKSGRGSGGNGVDNAQPKYWQRRIAGLALSACYHGERLLGVTRQLVGEAWTGAGEFQYCGSIGPWPLPQACEGELRRLGKVLCEQFELTELYGVDLVFDGTQAWVIEVNPRYTAAMEIVEGATGRSVFEARPLASSQASECGKAILFAKAPIVVTLELSQALLNQAGDLNWPTLADIPSAGTNIELGQPVLTAFASGNSAEEIESRLRSRVTQLQTQLGSVQLPATAF